MRYPVVAQAACLVEGSNQHHYHYHHRAVIIIIIIIIVGLIVTIFSGGAGVRGGLNWAVAVENCGGKGYNGSRREIP